MTDIPSDTKELPTTRRVNRESFSEPRLNHGLSVSTFPGVIRLVTLAVAVAHRTKQKMAETCKPTANPTCANRYCSNIGYTVPPTGTLEGQLPAGSSADWPTTVLT